MKRFLPLLAVSLWLLSLPVCAQEAPAVSAQSYILCEPESGAVLAEKDADEPRRIASTTKIMTALLVLEQCPLQARVEIQPEWAAIEGSSMYLTAGDTYTVEELLYGMMLASGNDAATALACYAAGSVEAFAGAMNARAEVLGCTHTHFENACGLDAEGHYSSARDLARITAEALKNEDFCRIAATKCKTVHGNTYYNHNKLLSRCEGVFGVKTGYTTAAGRSLVSVCERGNMTLICVTLCDPNDWNDHEALYDWGYSEWTSVETDEWISDISVSVVGGPDAGLVPARNERLLLRKDAERTVQTELPPFVFSGLEQGTVLGRVRLYADGECVFETPLCLSQSLPLNDEPLTPRERITRFLRIAGRSIYSF